MNINAEVVSYADVLSVGCLINTFAYCCYTADVAYVSVSAFLRKKISAPKNVTRIL